MSFSGITFTSDGAALDLSGIQGLGTARECSVTNSAGLNLFGSLTPRVVVGSESATYSSTSGFTAFSSYKAGALELGLAKDTFALSWDHAARRSAFCERALSLTNAILTGQSSMLPLTLNGEGCW
jgi:hypothetical protein